MGQALCNTSKAVLWVLNFSDSRSEWIWKYCKFSWVTVPSQITAYPLLIHKQVFTNCRNRNSDLRGFLVSCLCVFAEGCCSLLSLPCHLATVYSLHVAFRQILLHCSLKSVFSTKISDCQYLKTAPGSSGSCFILCTSSSWLHAVELELP
jgi:hypothetical protein